MNLALFDFDGTITNRELFRPFLTIASQPKRLAIAKSVLLPIGVGYKLGLVSGQAARAAAVRLCFTGLTVSRVEEAGQQFLDKFVQVAVRKEALDRINWHKAQGDRVVIVSGGLEYILSPWCKHHGVEMLCSSLEVKNGKLTGRYLRSECSGAEKVRRIRENYDLSHYPVIYAYGDSEDDMSMLSLAHKKYYRWREMSV
jgi:HAD superfamily hydrolase (TIGR01490 family)